MEHLRKKLVQLTKSCTSDTANPVPLEKRVFQVIRPDSNFFVRKMLQGKHLLLIHSRSEIAPMGQPFSQTLEIDVGVTFSFGG
jgi:hypothetical protein